MANDNLHKIGVLAECAGISTQTARAYHRRGLVIPDWISPKGTRYYSMETINNFIQIHMQLKC